MKLCLAVFAIWIYTLATENVSGQGNDVYTFKQNQKDVGQLVNCGASEGGSDFHLTWSPSVLSPNKKYTISFSGTASVDFTSGKVNTTVWIVGYDQPIYSAEEDVKCKDSSFIELPFAKGLLKCPVKAGYKIAPPTFTESSGKRLSEVPPGEYTVMLRLTNEVGKLFVCAKGNIYVAA